MFQTEKSCVRYTKTKNDVLRFGSLYASFHSLVLILLYLVFHVFYFKVDGVKGEKK